MDKVFPTEFKTLLRNPAVKKAFVSDVQPIGALDCRNCGGAEVMAIFIATKGPFQTPEAPYKDETSHFDETAGRKGGWWVGKTYTFPCPVCLGGKKPIASEPKSYPVQDYMPALVHPATGERLE